MKMTDAAKSALVWLRNRQGVGVFEKNKQVLVAQGERAPIMRSTWTALQRLGYVEITKSHVLLCDTGWALSLIGVEESSDDNDINGTDEDC